MRKALAAVATAVVVVALGAPAFADNHRSPSDHRISVMRDRGGDHHGGGRHDGFRHGDRDDHGRHGYDHDGYYRHGHGYDRDGYGYPYYYDGYYDGYYGDSYYRRCRWAYDHDRYYFDRYCDRYDYGYYRPYAADPQPAAHDAAHHDDGSILF